MKPEPLEKLMPLNEAIKKLEPPKVDIKDLYENSPLPIGVAPMVNPSGAIKKIREMYGQKSSLSLITGFNPILTTPCQHFDFANPPFDPVEFAKELVAFMYEKNGIGLAANQVGQPYTIFAMRGQPENYVFYNPKITFLSDEKIELEEGCLSFPGVECKIKRPVSLRLRFQVPNGSVMSQTFTGMSARVIQHEISHLNGELFFNHDSVSKYHRDKALKKFNEQVSF